MEMGKYTKLCMHSQKYPSFTLLKCFALSLVLVLVLVHNNIFIFCYTCSNNHWMFLHVVNSTHICNCTYNTKLDTHLRMCYALCDVP